MYAEFDRCLEKLRTAKLHLKDLLDLRGKEDEPWKRVCSAQDRSSRQGMNVPVRGYVTTPCGNQSEDPSLNIFSSDTVIWFPGMGPTNRLIHTVL